MCSTLDELASVISTINKEYYQDEINLMSNLSEAVTTVIFADPIFLPLTKLERQLIENLMYTLAHLLDFTDIRQALATLEYIKQHKIFIQGLKRG